MHINALVHILLRMNAQIIVTKLINDHAYTQDSLAEKLSEMGCKTDQSTIGRIKKSAKYQTGSDRTLRLFQLYQNHQSDDSNSKTTNKQ